MSSASSQDATVNVAANIDFVKESIKDAISKREGDEDVRLVAVSKTKPVELLMEAYEAGQRAFGENYAQELLSKAATLPSDIRWHFIGPLQSNKAAALVKGVGLEKLACIETVSTIKLANKLNRAVATLHEDMDDEEEKKRLGIYLQVNTSGEESKSGVSPDEVSNLAVEISTNCPQLQILGLMTIGAPGDFTCFDSLVSCRTDVANALGLESEKSLELSMGMSGDFEEAIARGSTSVRVGSTIFGTRDYSNLKK